MEPKQQLFLPNASISLLCIRQFVCLEVVGRINLSKAWQVRRIRSAVSEEKSENIWANRWPPWFFDPNTNLVEGVEYFIPVKRHIAFSGCRECTMPQPMKGQCGHLDRLRKTQR